MEERHAERDRITHDELVYLLCKCTCGIYEKEKEANPAVRELKKVMKDIDERRNKK